MKPEYEARALICKDCENLTIAHTCKICHCFMPAKVRFDGTSCPIGKWSKITRNPDGSVINNEK